MERKLDISVISPVFNELENLETFVESVTAVMNSTNMSWELIIVDDGSNDGSSKILKKIGHQDNIRSILLSKNYGQTTAIQAGFDNAVGKYFVTLDSDLQNDPKDIPMLIKKLINEELDLVVGWRKDRKDNYFFRNLCIFNYISFRYQIFISIMWVNTECAINNWINIYNFLTFNLVIAFRGQKV